MASLYSQAVRGILSNYADVIEGGNSYRGGGTYYNGIPGVDSDDSIFSDVAINAGAGSTSSSIVWADAANYVPTRMVREAGAPLFVLCSNSATRNQDMARKISTWGASSLTLGSAFPDTIAENDDFVLREGFKREPDNLDLGASLSGPRAWDRHFSLHLSAGKRARWYGNGVEQYDSQLVLRVRFAKTSRARRIRDTALESLLRIRSVITRPTLRDSFTQFVDGETGEPKVIDDTLEMIVVEDTFRLVYRVVSTNL